MTVGLSRRDVFSDFSQQRVPRRFSVITCGPLAALK